MSERPVVVVRPDEQHARPILVEVPHAGVAVPSPFRGQLLLDEAALRRDADLYVDRLYAEAPRLGATLVYTEISRFVVDLNRSPDDVDALAVPGHAAPRADAPRGLIWRVTTDGVPALAAPLSLEAYRERLEHAFHPYHQAVDEEVARLRARFGALVVLSGHSMPSVGKATHADPGQRRADVVPGDLLGHSCDGAVTRAAVEHFERAGMRVALNDPYKGGNTTRRLGKPGEGLHALQVELNRDLYMDETTFAIKEPGFSQLSTLCLELVESFGRLRMSGG